MYEIAIVDDKKSESAILNGYISKFFSEVGGEYKVDVFDNGFKFLESFSSNYKLVFLDIEMPNLSGMDVASEIRNIDKDVCIVFCTCFARYAVKGYEVSAFDYFVKPFDYSTFYPKMQRILTKLNSEAHKPSVMLRASGESVRLNIDDIAFVEVHDHELFYYVGQSKPLVVRQSMKAAEEMLGDGSFVRCNDGCLINLKYVTCVRRDEILLGKRVFAMSRSKKKKCLEAIADFYGKR